jgi:pimeloyl-ACP methyl ester carboxylesterase
MFPTTEIQTKPVAGHWLHADEPEEFLRLVRDYLQH